MRAAIGGERLLVWSGNSHALKEARDPLTPMGVHFAAESRPAFFIDQTVTVDLSGRRSWVPDLLSALADVLAAHGGTAGILREHAPALLSGWTGTDALIVSTDNKVT